MNTVIFFSNDNIKIVKGSVNKKGKIKTKAQISIDLEPSSLLNGVIINKDHIIQKLRENRKLIKNATVLIDSSNIIVKKLNIPPISRKNLLEILKKEFDFSINRNDFVYDANMGLDDDSILGAAISIEFVESYLNLFKEAKINIKKIDIGINVLAKFVSDNEALTSSTFILNIVRGKNLLSILFENGTFTFIDRSNLSSFGDLSDVTTELFSKMSQLIQFSKSKKSEHIIEKSYYIGLDEEVLESLVAHTTRFETDISVEALVDENISYNGYEFMYPLLALGNSMDDMDLYKVSTRNTKSNITKRENRSNSFKRILTLTLILIPIVAWGMYYYLDNEFYTSEVTRIESFLSDEVVTQIVTEVSEHKKEIVHIANIQNEISRNLQDIADSRIVDKNMLSTIYAQTGETVEIFNISYLLELNEITISASAVSEFEAADYISKLRNTGLFESILYSGYQFDEKTEEYLFSASVILAGGQTNED